jgi:hypothetical protein
VSTSSLRGGGSRSRTGTATVCSRTRRCTTARDLPHASASYENAAEDGEGLDSNDRGVRS